MLRTLTQRWVPALFAALVLPVFGLAQDADPALGVARVSLINGDVTTQRGESGDWIEATVNLPLVEDDTLAAGDRSRAEIQLDFANFIRLDANTAVRMVELKNRVFRVQLLEGTLNYSELKNGEADIDIETPQAVIRPQERGSYRVHVLGEETTVTVWDGRAEIASNRGTEILKQGDTMFLRGGGDTPEFRIVSAGPRDGFDDWNRERDRRLEKSHSYDYVSQDITGAADLDDHGDWRYVNGYGRCWYPRGVDVGWAPYRYGRWNWVDYYGWSWVGYEPWGWAPYHYGRWFYTASYGWGWHPGYYRARHYWRPALVSFFGYSGRNFSVGVGFGYGGVGWIPLAPGERYYPWYGRGYYGGRGRGNQTIIVDNSVNIYNNYRNARVNNGVTVVDSRSFSRGLVNQPRSLRANELRRATAIRGQIPVVPDRASQGNVRQGNARIARLASSRSASSVRGTNTRAAANRVERVSFDQQRSAISNRVSDFRTNPRTATAANGASGVRGASSARSSSVVRTPSANRTEADARGTRSPGINPGSRATTSSRGWRTLGGSSSGVATRGSTTRSTAPRTATRSSSASRTGGSAASRTRSSSSTTRSSSRVTTPRSSSSPAATRGTTSTRSTATRSRTNSRITTPSPSSTTRGSSRTTITQPSRSRSSSRASTSRTAQRSGVSQSSSRSSFPSRSSSRAATSRTAPRSSVSRSSSRSSFPSRSATRGATSRSSSRSSFPSRSATRGATSRSSSPRMSAPSRSSRPRMSAPSRSSSPRMSAPSRSSSPRMSAPSRSSSGARSAPSRSSGASSGRGRRN